MKILLLNDDALPIAKGGAAVIVENLRQEYIRRGHDVTVLTTHRVEEDSHIIREESLISLPISYRTSLRHYKCLRMPRVSRMIREEVARLKPDVVHAHNIHQYLTYDALRIAHECTPSVFLTLHDVFSFAFARLTLQRYLDSGGEDAHLSLFDHYRAVGLQYNPFRNSVIRSYLRKYTKAVMTPSDALRRAAEVNGIRCQCTIHNGIDCAHWKCPQQQVDALRNTYELEGRSVILFSGRLSDDKGSIWLLQALDQVRHAIPSVLLLVAGEQKRWLKPDSSLAGHCRCTGWLNREAMQCAVHATDVVAVPSVSLDTFPTTNLEAMASAKPVVGTIFGGTPEVVAHEETGFVCDPRDTDTFAGYLTTLLQDSALRKKMGEAGRKRVEEHFSLKSQADELLELYQNS